MSILLKYAAADGVQINARGIRPSTGAAIQWAIEQGAVVAIARRLKMSEAKHTPGPWELDGLTVYKLTDEPKHKQANVFCARVDAGYTLTNGRTSFQECQANARLIAAAPELLEAAQMVIAWYEAEDDHSKADFYERMQMCRDSESALRAAIAKATGEQA